MDAKILPADDQSLAEVGSGVMDILDQAAEQAPYEPGFLAVKINHGSKSFDAGALGSVNSPIECVILAAEKLRALWPTGDDDAKAEIKVWSGPAPLCSSRGNGGVRGGLTKVLDADAGEAIEVLLTPPSESEFMCQKCQWNEFGSADRGAGKACKEMRRLLIFIPEQAQIGVLSVPPSSLKAWGNYINSLPRKRFDLIISSISAVPEQAGELKYSVLDFTPAKEKGKIVGVTPDVLAPLGRTVSYGGKDIMEIQALFAEFSQLELVEDQDYPANGKSADDSTPFDDEKGTEGEEF